MIRRTHAIAALIGTGLVLGAAATARAELTVMSFNIRFNNGISTTQPTDWRYACGPRSTRAVNTIEAFDPDILGVQEALVNQMNDLGDSMPQYLSYGVGRDDGGILGEFSGIFYRASRFSLLDSGTFWLSATPNVPGSKWPGSGSIRIASWVILGDLAAGGDYFVLNTHWDNVCSSCNLMSASLVRDKIDELSGGLPIIVLGDLNQSETSNPLEELRGENDPGGFQLIDAYRAVFPVVDPNEATFHGFNGGTAGSRIDHIVATNAFTPLDASIDHASFSCGYPSDHYPVTANFDEPGTGPAAPAPGVPADPCDSQCTPPSCAPVAAGGASARAEGAWVVIAGLSIFAIGRRARRARP
ncbi:MAG: endonuclease/exonuclease/phosphatase family protein [Myxococcales bacterium]|nr:endonuclease/exonuclease/phosphatase family protein [Myxococcales bacterium]